MRERDFLGRSENTESDRHHRELFDRKNLEISRDSDCRERESNPHEVALGGF
jgi:hypothetical protein